MLHPKGEPAIRSDAMFANDADTAAYFERELTHVKARVYEKKHVELKAKALLPVSREIDEGAETGVYQVYDSVGMARVIANYADDLQRVDIMADEVAFRVRGIGDSYAYSVQDVRAARLAGRNLNARKALAARRAVEVKEDHIAWFGDPEYDLQGLFYNPNVSSYLAATGASSNTNWIETSALTGKTPDEIIQDVNDAINYSIGITNGVEEIDTVLLPPDEYAYINSTPRSSLSDTTILEFLRSAHPGVTFEPLARCADLDTPVVGGGDTSNIMVCYRNNEEVLSFEIPMDFFQHPAQARNLEWVVNCEARNAGVQVYLPLAVTIVEGI